MSFNFFARSNITFGRGASAALPELLKKYDLKKIMLVYDGGVKAAGIADKVIEQIEKAGVTYKIFDGVIPNPTNEVVETAAKEAREFGADGFIAVGGGSPIRQYGGIDKVPNSCLPLIAIPTTAGTSSEITNVSALIDTEKVVKYVVIDNKIVASDVIADPEFTKTMPAGVTAATGMDAITHAVESYISNMASPLTKYHSLKGLQILYENLPKAVENGADMDARENMMLGCIITGFGFAAVLPYVMRYNAQTCAKEMAEMAQAIGLETSGDEEKDKYLLADALLELLRRLKIRTLSEQGIKEEDFEMLADDVLKEPVLGFNPRQNITKEDVIEILKKAY